MCKIALFGDSYISRLKRFCYSDLKIPGDVRFFGKGGMKFDNIPSELYSKLLSFSPDVVFLSLGGNSIKYNSVPKDIIAHIRSMVETLKSNGVKKVYVAEISERGSFTKSPGLTKKAFEAQRKKINKTLRKVFQKDFITFKDIKYPADYDNDLVHFGSKGCQRGMQKYFYSVRRVLLSFKNI